MTVVMFVTQPWTPTISEIAYILNKCTVSREPDEVISIRNVYHWHVSGNMSQLNQSDNPATSAIT